MGLLADFYVSSPDLCKAYNDDQTWPEQDRAQFKGITPLELSMLVAFRMGREWDVDLMDDFPNVLVVDGGERLIHEIPAKVRRLFVDIGQDEIAALAEKWAETEELACDPSDIEPVVCEIVRLSERAEASGKSLYLWNCV